MAALPAYTSLELVEIAWRGRGVAALRYRPRGAAHYPPGTFSMLWVPGHEAIPMTPLQSGGHLVYIVKARGPTTRRLVENPPKWAGAIGPLGRPFAAPPGGKWLHIAGGTGVAASLSILARAPGTLVYGAKSSAETVPLEKLGLLPPGVEVRYATEDGTLGYHGTVLDLAASLAEGGGFTHLTAAGPRPVLCGAARLAERYGLEAYLSPEATIRCGLGFCGRCSLHCSGKLLCRVGLFFDTHSLRCWLVRECG